MTSFKEKLEHVQSVIERAAAKSGRSLKDITLVAVTKGAGVEKILEAVEAGVQIFGENRIQEAETKIPATQNSNLQWHMVGHLQSNKVKTALNLFSLIQSVDSVRLAKHISDAALAENKTAAVLLEVNISGESQKYGFKPEEVYNAIDAVAAMPAIQVQGLMGIAPNAPDLEARRAAFKKLKGIFSVCKTLKHNSVQMKVLSMGMSDDFEAAVEEGATMVRLGRVLFR